MFLNKFLAAAGVASRRKSVEEIKKGHVTVNGIVQTSPAYVVLAKDVVQYKDVRVKPEKHTYILLNKPEGYITTVSDMFGRDNVMDLIKIKNKVRLFPVGRLDRSTTGILLITNDGDFSQKLAHPKYEVSKVYEVTLDQDFDSSNFPKLLKGIRLQDGLSKADRIFYTKKPSRKKVTIELHSGKNRIVRRLFKALGYNVIKLDRIKYGCLNKRGVKKGEWRYLTDSEIESLKNITE